jgi:ankyrin repeat protein
MNIESHHPSQVDKPFGNDVSDPPLLYNQVSHLQWNLVIARCNSHPSEAHYQDRGSGITALHVACRTPDTPPPVVHALLKAYPKAAAIQTKQYASTPLHFACWRNLDEKVVRMLVRVYPRAASTLNGLGLTPLHLAARTRNIGVIGILLQTCPEAACSASVVGYTPLHLAIRSGAAFILSAAEAVQQHLQEQQRHETVHDDQRTQHNPEPQPQRSPNNSHESSETSPHQSTVIVVRSLIQRNFAVLHIKDRDGETPLRHFCHHMEPVVLRIMVEARNSSSDEVQYLRSHPIIQQCWETFQLLVKAAAPRRQVLQEDGDLSEDQMMHATVQNLDCIENFTFSLLTIKLCRDQLSIADHRGDLPVHILSSISVVPQRYTNIKLATSSSSEGSTDDIPFPTNMNSMKLFLAPYKAAASTPNRDGDLPLHLVLRHNAQWEDGIESLLRCYPAAVTIPDKRSGFYPFMMAAVADSSASMTTLYNLLRACPELSRFHKRSSFSCSRDVPGPDTIGCSSNCIIEISDPDTPARSLRKRSSSIDEPHLSCSPFGMERGTHNLRAKRQRLSF